MRKPTTAQHNNSNSNNKKQINYQYFIWIYLLIMSCVQQICCLLVDGGKYRTQNRMRVLTNKEEKNVAKCMAIWKYTWWPISKLDLPRCAHQSVFLLVSWLRQAKHSKLNILKTTFCIGYFFLLSAISRVLVDVRFTITMQMSANAKLLDVRKQVSNEFSHSHKNEKVTPVVTNPFFKSSWLVMKTHFWLKHSQFTFVCV